MINDPEQNASYNIKVLSKLVATRENSKSYNYRFCFSVDKITDRLISKFLFHRQVEIIRELKDASDLGVKLAA
jgi:hypothetical protein